MTDAVRKDAKARMEKTLGTLSHNFVAIRAGRATPQLLEQISVDYYGTMTPIPQVANVTAEDARTLKVVAWDKNMTTAIEKAILQSDLGLNPATMGEVIRIPLPPLTEDRRKELIKVVRNEAENTRIAVRNIRRDANNDLRRQAKEKTITQDEVKHAEQHIQQTTDTFIDRIDTLLQEKETELLTI